MGTSVIRSKSTMKVIFTPIILCIIPMLTHVRGHGYLIQPPARGSAWRVGFNTPRDVTDNEENCGGFATQWDKNGGKCGICGDPWNGKKENETPGKYASGTIVANYTSGQTIDVAVKITANHKGWFEFKLCENNDPQNDKSQECFDRHLLEFASGETRMEVGQGNKLFKYRVKLPAGVTCQQCILQWHYNAGNSWGTDPDTGKGCIGCGPQETFMGCADVAISGGGEGPIDPVTSTRQPPTTTSTSGSTMTDSPDTTTQKITGNCKSVPPYDNYPNMDDWCKVNCALGNCPLSHCKCE